MFYEMQFKVGKVAQIEEASLSSISSLIINNLRDATIIFDAHNNCLFLNQAASQVFGDRSNISLVGDWIRAKIEAELSLPMVFKLQELPLQLADTEGLELPVAVILQQQPASDKLSQELNQHKSLAIREPKIQPQHLDEYGVPPLESINQTITLSHDLLTG
ncbi:MAG: diguanylate cyclase domain-containing protein, partial [Waterburya sp.]